MLKIQIVDDGNALYDNFGKCIFSSWSAAKKYDVKQIELQKLKKGGLYLAINVKYTDFYKDSMKSTNLKVIENKQK